MARVTKKLPQEGRNKKKEDKTSKLGNKRGMCDMNSMKWLTFDEVQHELDDGLVVARHNCFAARQNSVTAVRLVHMGRSLLNVEWK
ncbi:hypothetical protein TNCV_1845831 [Trichonephila clavipes]|nr:hypothetical protein TNCV_1845831 [Trichonephila clavipes]